MRSDDILIPEFEIANGWYVSELNTEQDCRDAKDLLDATVIAMKDQRNRYDSGMLPDRDDDWRMRLETAMRYKQVVRNRINQKLGELTGMRHLHRSLDDLRVRMSEIRELVKSAPDESLRADVAALVAGKLS